MRREAGLRRRLWAGRGGSRVLGFGSGGRGRRPHRGNRSAAATPCRPRDCLSSPLEVGVLWPPVSGNCPAGLSQTPASSPRRRQRRHAGGGRQIPEKVTTPPGSAPPPWPGALRLFVADLGGRLGGVPGQSGGRGEAAGRAGRGALGDGGEGPAPGAAPQPRARLGGAPAALKVVSGLHCIVRGRGGVRPPPAPTPTPHLPRREKSGGSLAGSLWAPPPPAPSLGGTALGSEAREGKAAAAFHLGGGWAETSLCSPFPLFLVSFIHLTCHVRCHFCRRGFIIQGFAPQLDVAQGIFFFFSLKIFVLSITL